MTTRAQLRRAATALPGVEEHRDGRNASRYTVDGTEFARCDADGIVRLALGDDDAAAMGEQHPGGGPGEVALDDINGQQLNHWVRAAWQYPAPAATGRDQAAAA